tara:strand:+ start:156 stop:881 length:726 start_codon:yes stop_codon:yes gene_type:complete
MVITQPIIHDRHLVKQAFEQLKESGPIKFEHPKDLTIATCRNEGTLSDRIIPHLAGYEDTSILEKNMEYLGLDLVVLRDARLPWRNTFKFEMLNNYLKDCPTEYFMCLDAIDVIWVDEPQKVVDIFKSFNCDALFMSTHSTDGYSCMSDIKQWVDTINKPGRYLNSGVYIGKTSFIKEMIEEAMKYAVPPGVIMGEYHSWLETNPKDYPKGSQDQDIFRYIEQKFYPRMKVDYRNQMAFRS